MALTLLDVARNKDNIIERDVVLTFARECDLSKLLPLDTIGTTEVHTKKQNGIPTVGFRSRGQSFGSVSGVGTTIASDAVWSMGGEIDIDVTDYLDKNNGTQTATDRLEGAVKGLAWTFNDYVINGDHAIDADGFEGIKVRMANLASAQTVYAKDSSNALDVRSVSSPTNDVMFQFLDGIDNAIDAMDGHKADIAITDADVIRTIKRCERRLGLYKDDQRAVDMPTNANNMRRTSADPIQTPTYIYNETKFFAAGKKADQSTDIVGTTTVGGQACRPIYFIKLGKPYLRGIQQYPFKVYPYSLLENKVQYRAVVDWPIGLSHVHPKSFSTLRGSQVA